MTRRGTRGRSGVVLVAILAVGGIGLAGGQAVAADDVATAWSVSPAGPDGKADGRTRFELQADPGGTLTDKVVIANASTVERTFDVYGADAMNTPTGGYDLQPAATTPTDVGSWVTTSTPTVTIPALSTAVVDLAVAVPAGATPGDYPGGIAVSLDAPQVGAGGVLLDTRVAVRFNVRVAGEVSPSLTVRGLTAGASGSWVPFARTSTTVRYELANTGNVTIVGKPRLRVTGPFGMRLASLDAAETSELLPGQSFTVETVVPGVWPLGVLAAVVDVGMAAAPGPATDVPLVSSTASGTFFSVSWTGLVALVALVLLCWRVIRTVRRRRDEAEELWRRSWVDDDAGTGGDGRAAAAAGSDLAVVDAGRSTVAVVLLTLALGAGALLAGVATAGLAAAGPVATDDSDQGTFTLTVPAAPVSPGASTATIPSTGSYVRDPSAGAAVVPEPTVPSDAATAGAVPTSAPTKGPEPDLVWSAPASARGPVAWALLGIGGVGAATALGLAVPHVAPHVVRYAAMLRGVTR